MIYSKLIYKEGAHKGLYFGFYLIAVFLFTVWSDKVNLLSVPAILLLCAVPFVIFTQLAIVHKKYSREGDFSSLWMLGIMIFICGSLICALFTYSYLQYVDPGFVERQAENALAIYKNVDGLKNSDFVKVLQTTVDNNMLPSPIQIAVELLWMTSFFGSLLSMLIAVIVKAVYPKQNRR